MILSVFSKPDLYCNERAQSYNPARIGPPIMTLDEHQTIDVKKADMSPNQKTCYLFRHALLCLGIKDHDF